MRVRIFRARWVHSVFEARGGVRLCSGAVGPESPRGFVSCWGHLPQPPLALRLGTSACADRRHLPRPLQPNRDPSSFVDPVHLALFCSFSRVVGGIARHIAFLLCTALFLDLVGMMYIFSFFEVLVALVECKEIV